MAVLVVDMSGRSPAGKPKNGAKRPEMDENVSDGL